MSRYGTDTLRVVYPHWQGGNDPKYQFGAQLLAFLAPPTSGPVVTVPVPPPNPGEKLPLENGVRGRTQVLQGADAAANLIRGYRPRRVVTLGGDCFVSLAPFAYLADTYRNQKFGILWIDAHPDVTTPKGWENAHTYVLSALLGVGDKEFVARVPTATPISRAFVAGMTQPSTKVEEEFFKQYPLMRCGPDAIKSGGAAVLDWIRSVGLTHVAIHWDLDVLDYKKFRSCMFANPAATEETYAGIAKGELELSDVVTLTNAVAGVTDVVGLSIAEHFPWESMALRDALAAMPILRDSKL